MQDWFSSPFFQSGPPSQNDIKKQVEEMETQMINMVNSMNPFFRNIGTSMLGFENNDLSKSTSQRTLSSSNPHPTFSGTRSFNNTMPTRTTYNTPNRTDSLTSSERFNRSTNALSRSTINSNDGKDTKPQFYAAAMSSFCGPDGLQQTKTKSYDSLSGKTQLSQMKKLGDQSVSVHREIDRDGKITDTMDRENVDEKDVADFRRRWDSRANELTRQYGLTTSTPKNALK